MLLSWQHCLVMCSIRTAEENGKISYLIMKGDSIIALSVNVLWIVNVFNLQRNWWVQMAQQTHHNCEKIKWLARRKEIGFLCVSWANWPRCDSNPAPWPHEHQHFEEELWPKSCPGPAPSLDSAEALGISHKDQFRTAPLQISTRSSRDWEGGTCYYSLHSVEVPKAKVVKGICLKPKLNIYIYI